MNKNVSCISDFSRKSTMDELQLHVIIMSRTNYWVNPHSIVWLNVKEVFARSRRHIWSLSKNNVIRTHNHLVRKQTFNYLAKLAKWLV